MELLPTLLTREFQFFPVTLCEKVPEAGAHDLNYKLRHLIRNLINVNKHAGYSGSVFIIWLRLSR